ncbi:DENN domain-containing protein 2B [Saguinus oedipus]|uniref:DENN domain-containing protein 2B n=1 Tax=Saguinus oedipus TaxID=9490 RepID=A0ABQ9UUP0_SAGOE|nr:DENN domain-containing protein 2B [Saguinus oedipus]
MTHELRGQAEAILFGDLPKENPYEDVDLKSRRAGRKSQQLSENSLDSLHRMWSPQDRKYNSPPTQLSLKPNSQSLRSGNWSERKSHRLPRLPKRHSHDDMLLLAQLSLPSSPSSLNEDSLSTTSELLSSRRARRIPKGPLLAQPPTQTLSFPQRFEYRLALRCEL